MAEIQRDTISDRIGTVLWWLIIIFAGIVGVASDEKVFCAIVGVALAYGVYYLITGRTD